MILVVGSTGLVGAEIVRLLTRKAMPVRALVRTTSAKEKVEALKDMGAELAVGDLREPATLDAALQGIDTVISTATTTASTTPGDNIPEIDHLGQLNLVEAARRAGVKHCVYVSYSGNIDPESPSPLTVAKREVEKALLHSGIPYTILRPSCFMEVWVGPALGFDPSGAKAVIYGEGHNKLSFISLFDVAQAAVESLDCPPARNAVIEMGGPEPLSPLECVRIFEEEGGKPFDVQFMPVDVIAAQNQAAADPLQKSFTALMMVYARGDEVNISTQTELFPWKFTSLRDYARRALQTR